MKKTKQIAICIGAIALALAMTAIAGCNLQGDRDGVLGEVSDSQWQQLLSIDIEDCASATVEEYFRNVYGKDEAEEYGEWSSDYTQTMYDRDKQILKEVKRYESYDPTKESKFATHETVTYWFAYNGKYYSVESETVNEITKAEFIRLLDNATSDVTVMKVYSDPSMRSNFEYNKETKMYEYSANIGSTMRIGIQFYENGGVRFINTMSIEEMETRVYGFNSTKVEIPQEIFDLVDAYILGHAETE